MMKELKAKVSESSHKYEIHLTCVLIIIAVVLLIIACFGSPEHKALATVVVCL
jgi:uncharacterized membrane protein